MASACSRLPLLLERARSACIRGISSSRIYHGSLIVTLNKGVVTYSRTINSTSSFLTLCVSLDFGAEFSKIPPAKRAASSFPFE